MSLNIVFFTTRFIDIPDVVSGNDKDKNLFKNPDNEDYVKDPIRRYLIKASEEQYRNLKISLSHRDGENKDGEIRLIRNTLAEKVKEEDISKLSDDLFVAFVRKKYQDISEVKQLVEQLSQLVQEQKASARSNDLFLPIDFNKESVREKPAINLDGHSSNLKIKHRLMLYKMKEERDGSDRYIAYAVWPLLKPANGQAEEEWKKALTDEVVERYSAETDYHLILGIHDGDLGSTVGMSFKCISYKEPIMANDRNKVRSLFVFAHASPEMSKLQVEQGDMAPTAKEVFQYFDGLLSNDCYRVFSKVNEANMLASAYKKLQKGQ